MNGGLSQHPWWRRRGVIMVALAAVIGLLSTSCQQSTTPEAVDDPAEEQSDPAAEVPGHPADLTFDTPEQALDNFLEALDDGRFEVAAEMLSRETQQFINTGFNSEGITTLRGDDAYPAMDFGAVSDALFLPRHVFAELMELAAISGSLPIDLTGGINQRMVTTDDQTATIEGQLTSELPVTVTLSANDADEWRIVQIATPGGDPDTLPFSAPAGNEPPAREANTISRYADRFPMETPEAFAVAVMEAVEADDYFLIERILAQASFLGLTTWLNLQSGTGRPAPIAVATPVGRNLFDDLGDLEATLALFDRWDGGISELLRRADAAGAAYIDPVAPYVVDAVTPGGGSGSETVVAIADGNEVRYEVTVVDVGDEGWRLHQILADDGDPKTVPFSGPTGLDVPAGAVACWDHVRYDDCGRDLPLANAAAIEELRDRAEAGEIDPVEASVELARLQQQEQPRLDEICASMQGTRDDLVFSQAAIDLAPTIVEEYCPGDPALLVLDPDS